MTEPNGLPRIGNGSLTEQATTTLLEAILAKHFPGNQLPAEPSLAAELGVSRTTIRGALMTLERLGVITRTPGRGTTVRPHVGRESLILQRLVGFRSLLEEKNHVVEVRQQNTIQSHPGERAIERLGVDVSTAMVHSCKQVIADGHPAIFIEDEIPFNYCSEADQERLRYQDALTLEDSIFEFSKAWNVGPIEHTVIELAPSVAPRPAAGLGLDKGTPLLRLLETHYRYDGKTLALSEVQVDDRYVRFSLVRHS